MNGLHCCTAGVLISSTYNAKYYEKLKTSYVTPIFFLLHPKCPITYSSDVQGDYLNLPKIRHERDGFCVNTMHACISASFFET